MERLKSAGFLLLVLACVGFVAVCAPPRGDGIKPAMGESEPRSESFVPTRKIVLDAGHGGFDGGAVSDGGLMEKDINLKIAEKLEHYLIFGGYEVIMTRKEDKGLDDEDADSIRNKKRTDILNRLEIVNREEEGIFVSIHLNSFPQSQYHGSQVFYSTYDEKSKKLAAIIRGTLKMAVDPDNEREIKKAYDTIYLMRHAKKTAVLVECGFLSNEHETELLMQDEYQNKIAFAIFCAIEKFNSGDMPAG